MNGYQLIIGYNDPRMGANEKKKNFKKKNLKWVCKSLKKKGAKPNINQVDL